MTIEDKQKLDEIHTAIVGNPSMGTKGLATRIGELEDYKKSDEKMKYKVAGGLAVGTPIFVVAWEWLKGKLMGQH